MDYASLVKALNKKISEGGAATEEIKVECQEAKHELYRYQNQYKSKIHKSILTQFPEEGGQRDNFTQVLNNKPLPMFRSYGVGTRLDFADQSVQCSIFKPPPVDTQGVEIPKGSLESKLRHLKGGIQIFYKSSDNILHGMK